MIDLSQNYIDLLLPFFSDTDSTGLEEFTSIFMPSDDFVCRFREVMPDYIMHLEPLNTGENNNSLLKVFIPQCVTDTVEDRIVNDFFLEADMTAGISVNLIDATFIEMAGIALGENSRIVFNPCHFIPSDEAFIPANMLSTLFLYDSDVFPMLSGDVTCAFYADSSGVFSLLDGALTPIDSCIFSTGANNIVFEDTTGFFTVFFDVDAPTLISDATILFYPDEYSEPFLTTYEMLSILKSTLYTVS